MHEPEAKVCKREDSWVDVPAVLGDLEIAEPIQLRPGSDDGRLSIKVLGADKAEVSITDLVGGIRAIQEEHAR